MRHARAQRLLPSLLDQTLPAPVEAEVRAHAEDCGRCSIELAEHMGVEALLARLPVTLVPGGRGPAADDRLRRLADWVPDPVPSWSQRLLGTAGAVAAALAFVLLVELGSLAHYAEPPGETVTLAAVLPASRLFPTGLR